MRAARRSAPRRHPPRRLLARAFTAALAAALLVPLLPALYVAGADGPVKVKGREVGASVERQRLIPLPFESSHVALRWNGSPDAQLSISFGQRPTELGDEVPVGIDEEPGDEGEVYSAVLWTGGARFARVTTDRPLPSLKLIAMDAVARAGGTAGGGSAPLSASFGAPVAQAATDQPFVLGRADWNADESLRFDGGGYERFPRSFFPVQKTIVHHTAGRNDDPDPEATIRAIYYLHAIGRGYGDIDYNFLIDWQGRIYEGRYSREYATGERITGEDLAGNSVRASHAADFNAGTVGIALLGTYTSRQPPPAQLAALEQLLAWKLERHGLNPLGASTYVNPESGISKHLGNISGHRNVTPTACPGQDFYDTFPALRQRVADRIAATTGLKVDHMAPSATLGSLLADPTGAGAIPFGLTFSEPVTGLGPNDFVVAGTSTGWRVDSVTGTAARYQVVVGKDPDAPPETSLGEGTVQLTLAAETVADLGGNVGPGEAIVASQAFVPDDAAPSVVLWHSPHRTYSAAYSFDWTVTFSEPVQGFGPEDIAITGGDADEWTFARILGQRDTYGFTTTQSPATNGSFALQVRAGSATDLAGNPIAASNKVTIVVDRSAPTTTVPKAQLRAGATLGEGSLRVNLSWTGTDVGPSGIASYDVAMSTDGGAFATIGTGVTASSLATTVTPGHGYRFQVRARDRAGNVGAWKATGTLTAHLRQNTATELAWGGSTGTATLGSYSGGSVRYLATAGSWARLTTTARSLSFVTTKGPNRGKVRIYVDGILHTTIDLGAPTYTYRWVAFSKSWSTTATHTIRVVAVGGSPARVDVDAFGVIR